MVPISEGKWSRDPSPNFTVSRCFQYLKRSQKSQPTNGSTNVKKSHGLISFSTYGAASKGRHIQLTPELVDHHERRYSSPAP